MSLLTMVNNCNRLCPGLNPDLVKSFIQDSNLQLSRKEWNMLKLIRNISTVAPNTTSLVDVDAAGIVTASGAATFTSAMVGRWMRLYYSDAIFTIATANTTTLSLTDWPGDILSGEAYSINKTIFTVPSPINLVFEVAYQTSLSKRSQAYFNEMDPSRLSTGTPLYWADAGVSSAGLVQIEIYPVPDQVYPLRVYGKVKSTTLGDNDSPTLPEDLIEAHALMALFRLQSSIQPKMGWELRFGEQQRIYAEILDQAMDEDYQRGSHSDHVKDVTDWPYPSSDTFRASHDVE